MTHLTRRHFIKNMGTVAGSLAIGTAGLASLAGCAPKNPIEKLIVQAPASPPSIALAKLVEDKAFSKYAQTTKFALWKTPDEMRARITSGQAQISGLPINVAATLYNKGLPVTLTSVYIWGILYVVSADPNAHAWEDLKGQELLIPFKGDSPDIVAQLLLMHHGLTLGQDIGVRYVSAATEAATMLAAGEAQHAVLSEPSATLAILSAQSAGISLTRAIDMQASWADATGQPARLPMAGVAVLPSLVQEGEGLLQQLQRRHAETVVWVRDHPAEAGTLGTTYIPSMPEAAMVASLKHIQFEFVRAAEARAEIEFFFQELARLSPALFGGTMPGDDFYYAG